MCVDPGSRHTGWCFWKSKTATPEHGVFNYSGQATGWGRADWFLVQLGALLSSRGPACVAFEDYHWMGRRRGYADMLKLIGAMAGIAWTFGCEIRWVRPKDKGKKQKPRPGWEQHDTDAFHLRGAL